MIKRFQCSLTGASWFPVYLYFYGIFLVYAGFIAAAMVLDIQKVSKSAAVPELFVQFLPLFCLLAVFLLLLFFTPAVMIFFMRKIIGSLSLEGEPFSFAGKPWRFLGMNIGYGLLSLLTFFVFSPWAQMILTRYLVREISFRDQKLDFQGRGWTLFLILLATILIPFLLFFAAVLAIVLALGSGAADHPAATPALTVLLYVLLIPLVYKVYQWYMNGLRYSNLRVKWSTEFWNSCLFMLGQLLLTVITAGIYWPAALIRAYRYFSGRTEVLDGDIVRARIGFDGQTARGFLLIWGQALLTIVTAGIYLPWAYAKCMKWFAAGTVYERLS